MSWLFNVVELEIVTTLLYIDSAAIAWKDLEDRYKITNKPWIFQIKYDISVMSSMQLFSETEKLMGPTGFLY